ncbi:alanine racemase [Ilumatobacter sp.]|uniref:alanine racemase n=1 Tax=Ilumatobacter sp. TaxID=1967498 RepID=UPI003AF9943D
MPAAMTRDGRWARVDVDPTAIEHNVRVLRRRSEPAGVWAVVKADGYGHGAVVAAQAALRAGAAGLCVALVAEGVELREAGVDAPILLLSEQPIDQVDAMLRYRMTPSVYTSGAVNALADRADAPVAVHVNVDTGMQRVGVQPGEVARLVEVLHARADVVSVAGVYTHLACADEPDHPANDEQLGAFDRVLAELVAAGIPVGIQHAANSAAALANPGARRSFVRAGIAIYGISPGPGVDHLCDELRPALALAARVSLVKRVAAGTHVSYGWRHRFDRDTTVATVPVGYADGVPRRLGTVSDGGVVRAGADVLIGGRRCPIVGVVTMDQFMVDVGDLPVAAGDDVVLIGEQGDERIRAEDWAERLGTIGYEVVCGLSARLPRMVLGDSEPS